MQNLLRVEKKVDSESKILVRGGVPLRGEIEVSGAKNAVLKLMAAAILIPGKVILTNVPPLNDVLRMIDILEFLGAKCKYQESEHIIEIDSSTIDSFYAPYDLVSKLRASFVVLGPLLSRMGQAKVSLPGGCQIGSRRINLHEKGLKLMGADMEIAHGYVESEAQGGRLKGSTINLDIPSNGATENLMMAAVLAEGTTLIENAAKDPEIVDLAEFLNKCGARISGAGTETISIEGVNLEDLHGAEHNCLPDRIEAGTFLIAGLGTHGSVRVNNMVPSHLASLLSKLKDMGAEIESGEDYVIANGEGMNYQGIELSTVWYPGFPTDMQPQLTALLTKAEGTSVVKETIYEDRFSHISELSRMGAQVTVNGNTAVINGVERLTGAVVRGSDLRATAGLVIAGLMAEGVSEVYGLNHLDRGYAEFTDKLTSIGAEVNRIN